MTDEFTQAVAELDSPVARMLEEKDAEIERLKAERDAAIKEMARWAREAGASQAREAKLREALEWCGKYEEDDHPANQVLALPTDDTALKEAIKVEYGRGYERGYDDGFLVGAEKGRNISEELKQAKHEAAEHIINMWREPYYFQQDTFFDRLKAYRDELK
jgi:flagellar biosynthesis/type III secretory pathway protein FliH